MSKDHVVSVRFDAQLLGWARELAAHDGVTVSDWLRNAAALEVSRRSQPSQVPGRRLVGYGCQHMTMTAAPGILSRVTALCGCAMQPIYAGAA